MTTVGDLTERDLIARIQSHLSPAPGWLAVGIGVNVANEIPAELATRAVSLNEFRSSISRLDVLDQLVPTLLRLTTHDARLSEFECAAFARRDWLRGRQIRSEVQEVPGGHDWSVWDSQVRAFFETLAKLPGWKAVP